MTNQSGSSGIAPPSELGHAETIAGVPGITAAFSDITALTLSVLVGVRAIVIEAFIPEITSTSANTYGQLRLVDITSGSVVIQFSETPLASISGAPSMFLRSRQAPPAGTRSYKLQVAVVAGTGSIVADANAPASLQIREV